MKRSFLIKTLVEVQACELGCRIHTHSIKIHRIDRIDYERNEISILNLNFRNLDEFIIIYC